MKFVFLFSIIICAFYTYSQEKCIISGIITDAENEETLVGVSVYESGASRGTTSGNSGRYSLTLPKGNYTIVFSFVGYEKVEKRISLNRNEIHNIQFRPLTKEIGEVTISGEAKDHKVKSTEMSIEKLSIKQVERIPVIMGETDIFKTIQLLPGITSVAEGRSGFIVRGSGQDQNLILMDGMPLYYSSHMQGLYSVFNSDAVDALTVYKGGIPARFGGRGASVLDVRMKESNAKEYKAKLSVGLITSKFSVEAPLIKDKLSVFLAGRSTKLGVGHFYDKIKLNSVKSNDAETIPGKGTIVGKGTASDDFYFFDPYESWLDLNGKIIYKMNDKNSFYVSGYMGMDSAMVAGGLTEWGNRAASMRWNHQFNSNFLSNTSVIYSRYYTQQTGGIYKFHSGITTSSFKQEFSYFPNDNNEIRFGFSSEYQDFDHGSLEDVTQDDAGKFMPPMQGLESALFIENDQKINSWLSAYYGLRFSLYHRLGPGNSVVYDEESNEPLSSEYFAKNTDVMAFHHNLEPRLALTFLINEKSSFKASYNRNAQYLRLMTLGAEIEWYDIWMPSTENIDPMITNQFALGYFRNFRNDEIQFSAETYYKTMNGAADFEDGLHNYLINNLEAYVATGIGRSYGFEASLEKPRGQFTGRISYNIGRAEYQIEAINKGRWYPNMFDKTHSLSIISSYEVLRNLTLSGTFFYSTGRPVTLPEAYYYVSGVAFPYWEGRNKYRLPDYHRLDFGIKYEPDFMVLHLRKMNREIKPSFEVSFYNVYNRRNVHTIEFSKGGKERRFEAYGVSTYGFMPSFQINIEF